MDRKEIAGNARYASKDEGGVLHERWSCLCTTNQVELFGGRFVAARGVFNSKAMCYPNQLPGNGLSLAGVAAGHAGTARAPFAS